VRAVIAACRELGVQWLSLYAFSTENWRRSEHEINALFMLLSKYIKLELDELHEENIRVTIMGRREGLPKSVLEDLDYCTAKTRNNTALTVNVAINYGSRGEIADATRQIAKAAASGALNPDEITEDMFAQNLYVPDAPDLDLLIRTSGELRLSNFMLWQVSYAELVVMKTLWPDFRKRHLNEAIRRYQARDRRFGGRKNKGTQS
jgi:undecaprenyl diphosphate synthase